MTLALFEPSRTVARRDSWRIDQVGYVCEVAEVPERVPAWHVFLGLQEIGTVQWACIDTPGDRTYWGTLRDGGAVPGTTMIGHSLEECADRMVRRWLGLPLPEAVRS